MYKSSLNITLLATGVSLFQAVSAQVQKHPNVLLIITDDQGYGDLGFTGNVHVKTPYLDNFAGQSIRFTSFYVSPVSAPTRSSLMTGRYSMRTGVRDTNNGGAIMATTEITMAEMLKQKGYRTGIFGKWHLGDNYPFRPGDQGFDESVIHLTGGMGQPGDITTYFRGDSSYFDPVLWHNGKQEKYKGYCSDIFASLARDFIQSDGSQPFFCYLAFNAPHTPLQVPGEYYDRYRNTDPSAGFRPGQPFPEMSDKDKEDARRVYAMVSNIDHNVGMLLKTLKELRIEDNTIVIFMTDNGPQQRRYVAGMRGLKGSVYRGGVRVPFLLRYPGLKISSRDVNVTAAHIDILPTIAALCNADVPSDRKIDGINLLPYVRGEKTATDERSLFFYWTRRNPEKYNNIALMKGRYRLIGNTDHDSPAGKFELYDVVDDPYELKNITSERSTIAVSMKKELDVLLTELAASENMVHPPCIEIGTGIENPVILNRNDAGGERGVWEQEDVFGRWNVNIKEGVYNIRFRFKNPVKSGGSMTIDLDALTLRKKITRQDALIIEMDSISLPAGRQALYPYYEIGNRRILPLWVELEHLQ